MSQQNLPAAPTERPDQARPTLTPVPPLTEAAESHVDLSEVETPQLRAITVDSAQHAVPPTVRHAGAMPANTLARRHQALKRLGVTPDPAEASPDPSGTPAAATPGVPDARVWGGRLAQAVSEVLAGDRPISQLVRFTDDVVFAELTRRVRLLGLTTTATGRGAKERSALRSVRVCCPAKDVAEVAAHVRHGHRSRAIALRLEIRRNRWVCTALELG
ncbi:Rv3235 family protein [Kribbella sp. NPDC050124]|uniref:Rv3235 family protein n=1 Tax=Kribbella sp. NPDC050124 TaxID=3364114 RepID=UPI0037AFA5CE